MTNETNANRLASCEGRLMRALQNIYARNVRRSGQRGDFHKRLVRELRRINNQILNLGRAS